MLLWEVVQEEAWTNYASDSVERDVPDSVSHLKALDFFNHSSFSYFEVFACNIAKKII